MLVAFVPRDALHVTPSSIERDRVAVCRDQLPPREDCPYSFENANAVLKNLDATIKQDCYLRISNAMKQNEAKGKMSFKELSGSLEMIDMAAEQVFLPCMPMHTGICSTCRVLRTKRSVTKGTAPCEELRSEQHTCT